MGQSTRRRITSILLTFPVPGLPVKIMWRVDPCPEFIPAVMRLLSDASFCSSSHIYYAHLQRAARDLPTPSRVVRACERWGERDVRWSERESGGVMWCGV
jgi:hypothetical protein